MLNRLGTVFTILLKNYETTKPTWQLIVYYHYTCIICLLIIICTLLLIRCEYINSLWDGGNGVEPGNLEQIYNYDASNAAYQQGEIALFSRRGHFF